MKDSSPEQILNLINDKEVYIKKEIEKLKKVQKRLEMMKTSVEECIYDSTKVELVKDEKESYFFLEITKEDKFNDFIEIVEKNQNIDKYTFDYINFSFLINKGDLFDDEAEKKIVKSKTMKSSLEYAIITTGLVYIFSKQIIQMFTLNSNIINSAVEITRIMLLGFPFMGIIYTLITFMQVSGQEEHASKLEFIRQVFLFIPLCLILPTLIIRFNITSIDPGLGVFFAMPISNMISIFFYTGRRVR